MSAKQTLITLMLALLLVATGGLAQAVEMPDQVSLDTMAELFDGVEFDHAMHSELGEDCSACHHHTTGTGTLDERCVSCHAESEEVVPVSCRGCHVADPFSAEHINRKALDVYQFHVDTPGLKAAYHWSCVNCHAEMGGPTDCQDCHARTAAGDDFYRADASGPSTSGKSGH
jgi:hypothetical protein